jgi:hypothetical protein
LYLHFFNPITKILCYVQKLLGASVKRKSM